jgi:DNA end-binding protein Ku
VYFGDTYYLGAGKNGERGYRVLVEALQKTHRIAVGTFTWRGKVDPNRDPGAWGRAASSAALLRRRGPECGRDRSGRRAEEPRQERTLAERLISELSATEFQPENYEDEYQKRLLKAIEQKIADQDIPRRS